MKNRNHVSRKQRGTSRRCSSEKAYYCKGLYPKRKRSSFNPRISNREILDAMKGTEYGKAFATVADYLGIY